VTILLALSVYQIIVNEKLPASSDEVSVIGNIYGIISKLDCCIQHIEANALNKARAAMM